MRVAELERVTREVKVKVKIDLDGRGRAQVKTGIRFLDHMLISLARHAYWDLQVEAEGDLAHHVMEDVALALGEAFLKALGEKLGLRRFGYALIPMDDSLSRAAVDLGGRPYIHIDLGVEASEIEDVKTEDIEHFIFSLGDALKANIHVSSLYGGNDHHIVESAIKALAVAFREASTVERRIEGEKPSAKGVL